MPVTLQWLLPDHILYAHYSGELTADDISYQYSEGIKMSESSDTPLVHLIANISDVTSFPTSIQAYKNSYGEKAKNAGWVLLVGNNKLARLISTIISNFMKLRFHYVNTIDDAILFLNQRDATIQIDQAQAAIAQLSHQNIVADLD